MTCGVVATSSVGLAVPAQASPYPSWAEVQAAKGDEAAVKKQIAALDDAITTLQNRAGTTSDSASGAGEKYQIAVLAEQKAKAELASVTAAKKKAAATAKLSEQRVGQLVAELSHAGGGQLTVTMLTESTHASDLLYELGTMTNLTSRTTDLLQQARQDQNVASALTDQASEASAALAKRSRAAASALSTANSLADAASAALATQQKNQTQLIAQVAYLKGTTAAVEKKYYAGLAAGTLADATPGAAGGAAGSGSTGSGSAGAGSAGSGSAGSGSTGSGSSGTGSAGSGSSGSGASAGSGTGSSGSGTTTPSKPAPAKPAPAKPAPAKPAPSSPAPSKPAPAPSGSSAAVNTAVAFAKAQLGKSYVWGAAGPNTWDCSGLMMGAYNAAGVYIGGHSVRWQYNYFAAQGRLVPISSMTRGDVLIYYNGTDGMYHDAMYLGDGTMLEAPNPSAKVRIVAVRYFQLSYVGRPVG